MSASGRRRGRAAGGKGEPRGGGAIGGRPAGGERALGRLGFVRAVGPYGIGGVSERLSRRLIRCSRARMKLASHERNTRPILQLLCGCRGRGGRLTLAGELLLVCRQRRAIDAAGSI